MPPEAEPAAGGRNRGRLDIGRNEVTVNVTVNAAVNSTAADPREVADEVADEIERRMQDRNSHLRDTVMVNPSSEVEY